MALKPNPSLPNGGGSSHGPTIAKVAAGITLIVLIVLAIKGC